MVRASMTPEGARGGGEESIEKFAGKKRAPAVREKSLMDHSFLFGRCYFLLRGGRKKRVRGKESDKQRMKERERE